MTKSSRNQQFRRSALKVSHIGYGHANRGDWRAASERVVGCIGGAGVDESEEGEDGSLAVVGFDQVFGDVRGGVVDRRVNGLVSGGDGRAHR